MRKPALLGEVGERGKMKSSAAPSSRLRSSTGSCGILTTKSTGGGVRLMTVKGVARSIPSVSRSFKSPDGCRSSLHHAAMTAQVTASLCTSCLLAITARTLGQLLYSKSTACSFHSLRSSSLSSNHSTCRSLISCVHVVEGVY